jgi:hypothetical protein
MRGPGGLGEVIIEAADAAGLQVRSYSGRGMFGRQCVAVEAGSAPEACFKLAAAIADAAADANEAAQLIEDLADACSDSMGVGVVIYWPFVEVPAALADREAAVGDEEG